MFVLYGEAVMNGDPDKIHEEDLYFTTSDEPDEDGPIPCFCPDSSRIEYLRRSTLVYPLAVDLELEFEEAVQ